MAVTTPVFERKVNTQKTEDERRYERMTAEDLHNSRISDNYARLVNPENKLKDIVASIDARGPQVIQYVEEEVQPVIQNAMPPVMQTSVNPAPVFFVSNARADADIFRADNPVNARASIMPTQSTYVERYEDENEDLRPTSTTIQYQTIGAGGAVMPSNSSSVRSEGRISRPVEKPRKDGNFVLKKRDKVILGVIVALILTIFTLIIVNSAVISNLSSDISAREALLDEAVAQYEQVEAELNAVTSPESVLEAAQDMGWQIG